MKTCPQISDLLTVGCPEINFLSHDVLQVRFGTVVVPSTQVLDSPDRNAFDPGMSPMAGLLHDPEEEEEGVHEGNLKEFNQRHMEHRNWQAGFVSVIQATQVLV